MDVVDTENRLPIGRFAALAELSASQLRQYDELGLLVPATRDPGTGYRYYGREQLRTAELIRILRDLDMPLAEIRLLLDGDDYEAVDRLLRRQRERMTAQQTELERVIARLDRVLLGKGGLLPYEPRLTYLDPQWVISRRYATARAEIDDVQRRAAIELRRVATACGALTSESETALYHSGLESIHGPVIDTEICCPILAERADSVPGAWQLPGGEAATLVHRGPWEDIRGAYVALYAWVAREGLDVVWPARETYLISDEHTDDPLQYVTSIAWLVTRPK